MPKLTSNLTGETIAQILASKGYEINQDTADTIGVSLCHLRKILNNKAAAPLILEKALDGLPDLTPHPVADPDSEFVRGPAEMDEENAKALLRDYCERLHAAKHAAQHAEELEDRVPAALARVGGVAHWNGSTLETAPGGTRYVYPAEIEAKAAELDALRESARKDKTATAKPAPAVLKFTHCKGCVL